MQHTLHNMLEIFNEIKIFNLMKNHKNIMETEQWKAVRDSLKRYLEMALKRWQRFIYHFVTVLHYPAYERSNFTESEQLSYHTLLYVNLQLDDNICGCICKEISIVFYHFVNFFY